MKSPAAAPANTEIKFNMKIHFMARHMPAGKALKAVIAAKKATKAIAKDIKKAIAKDSKKETAKDIKKDNAKDSKEGRNEGQGVLGSLTPWVSYIEKLDLHNQGLEKLEMDPSNTNTGVSSKVDDWIEKTLSNLSRDQV